MRSYVAGLGPGESPHRDGPAATVLAARRRAAAVRAGPARGGRLRSERRVGAARLILGRQGGGEPRPGALQPLQADGGELLAPFPEFERFLQGEPAPFQPLDDPDELVARLLVGHLRAGRPRLVAGGPAVAGLGHGALAAGRPPAAFRLTRLGGHGDNLAGYWPVMVGRPLRPGLPGIGGTAAVAGPVAWTADATTRA